MSTSQHETADLDSYPRNFFLQGEVVEIGPNIIEHKDGLFLLGWYPVGATDPWHFNTVALWVHSIVTIEIKNNEYMALGAWPPGNENV